MSLNEDSRPWRLLLPLALLLAILAYLPTLRFGFVYDDQWQLVNNPAVHSWAAVPGYFTRHVWQGIIAVGNYYRPVFLLWMRLNHALFGLHAWGFHLTNLLLHLLATGLVYRVAIRLGGSALAAQAAAAIFALHPAHIEDVAWIAGEPDLLACVFALASLDSYLSWRTDARNSALIRALFFFLLAVWSKENAIMLVLMLPAAELLLGSASRDRRTARLLPFFALTALLLLVRYAVLHKFASTVTPLPVSTVLFSAPLLLLFYLRQLLWPFALCPFYEVPYVSGPELLHFVLPVMALTAIAAGVWFWWRRSGSPVVAFGGLWVIGFLLPVLNISYFLFRDAAHDRFLYLPSVGFAFLAGAVVMQVSARWEQAQLAMPAALMLAFAAATTLQLAPWASDLRLFTRGAECAPNNPVALEELGAMMFERNEITRATELCERSLRLNPNAWNCLYNLGVAALAQRNYPEAERRFTQAIAARSDEAQQWRGLSIALLRQSRWHDAEMALLQLLARWPSAPDVHYLLGQALEHQGRRGEAVRQYREQATRDPSSPAAADLKRLGAE